MLTTKKLSGGAFSGLYDEGAGEYKWEPGPGTGDSGTVHSKKSDHLYVEINRDTTTGYEYASWTTGELHDLTNVDIIEAEFVVEGDDNSEVAIAIDPENDYDQYFDAYKSDDTYDPTRNQRVVHQLDVSADSGDYYITHQLRSRYDDNKLRTYRVELDP
jgi:hypothetical protein